MTAPRRLPPPPPVPAEARTVALTVPPPRVYDAANVCICCVDADATHGRPSTNQAGRYWLYCGPCFRATQHGPELAGPDETELAHLEAEILRDRLAYG